MSDPVTLARSARESLSKGLNALQSDPSVPAHLIELGAPIAQAMGALHQIEKGGGTQIAPFADNALAAMRTALSQMQTQPNPPAALLASMESVAASLGLVHQLSKLPPRTTSGAAPPPSASMKPGPKNATGPQFPSAAPKAPPKNSTSPMQQQPGAMGTMNLNPGAPPQSPSIQSMPAQQAAPMQSMPAQQPPMQSMPAQPPQAPPMQSMPAQPPQAPPVQAAPPPPAPVQAAPVQAPPQAAPVQAAADPFGRTSPAAPVPATAASPGVRAGTSIPSPPTAGGAVIDAALGAHSPTNFYKGLSGNDIIEHGGLFVATYMIPKIGAPVRLRIALPGGYEFEANAVVKWSRESGDPFGDSQPGFGAQFTAISPEARQLVYRYVRNREPLFHDDL